MFRKCGNGNKFVLKEFRKFTYYNKLLLNVDKGLLISKNFFDVHEPCREGMKIKNLLFQAVFMGILVRFYQS